MCGGGLFNVKSPELKVLRNHIADHINDFLAITNTKEFSDRLGRLKGDVSKRIDKAHEAVANKTPLIYNKQFYAMSNLSLANYYNSPNLKDDIIKHFNAIRPLNEFLNAAF